MTLTRQDWADEIVTAVGGSVNDQTRLALVNVFVAEGSRAEDNPADLTEPEPGATPYNTFDKTLHVWNYPDVAEGLAAIKSVLAQPNNERLLGELKRGASAASITAAFTADGASWASAGQLYLDTLPRTEADYATLAGVVVAAGPKDSASPSAPSAPPKPPSSAPPAKPAPAFCDVSLPLLREGESGYPVRVVQMLLVGCSRDSAVDGVFGPSTKAAVISFQNSKGIAQDGIVGPNTWENLIGRQVQP